MSTETEILIAAGLWVAMQVLQTIQIAIVGRKVTRTLMPPALPQQFIQPFCSSCGALTSPKLLRDGMCSECIGTDPTQPAPPRIRRRRE